VASIIGCAGCRQPPPPPAPIDLTIGTVFASGAWTAIGQALADAYSAELPGVRATVTTSEDLEGTADSLQRGDVQLAIEDVETAYVAFSRGTPHLPDPHRDLRAMAVLFSVAVHVVAPTNAGIDSIADLRGKRVGMGTPESPTQRAAQLILEGHGVRLEQITSVPHTGDATAAAIREGTLDAAFIYVSFQNPVVTALTGADDVRLLPIQRSSLGHIQEGHHFLKSTTIPGGTYKNQEEDVLTVGMDVVLLCRQSVPDALVYDLTKTLFDSLPALRQAHPSAAGIDPDRGPTSAIPLHPGAARYYRERELLR
jgi:TRAP transporter TAXI family solute receptor